MLRLRRYLIAGLLIWLPLGVTVLVVKVLVDVMDQTLLLLPPQLRPEALLGTDIPGLGILLTFVVLLVTGILVANFFGRRLLSAWESLLARIPLIRSVYSGAKQVAETVFADGGQSFKKVLLVEYPRKGLWSLAFQTSSDLQEIQQRTSQHVVCVFVPTTPNPTSGFIIMVPVDDVIELEMSVDDALKMVISLGVIVPPNKLPAAARELADPEGSP